MEIFRAKGFSGNLPFQAFPDEVWAPTRRQAARILAAEGKEVAASLMREIPFELGTASTGMHTNIVHALRASVSDELFDRICRLNSRGILPQVVENIIDALNRSGIPQIILIYIEPDAAPGGTPPVAAPNLEASAASVRAALDDAEKILSGGSSIGAVDRVHTALHGYLGEVCRAAGLPVPDSSPTVTNLWKKIRNEHPAFQFDAHHREHADRIMKAIAVGLDSLGQIRNQGSLAHANERLLAEPEAMLAVNFTRTVLKYVNDRLRT